jgi:hypothetical protein
MGASSGGVVNFSFLANTSGAPRTAHITVLGQPVHLRASGWARLPSASARRLRLDSR